MTYADCAPSCHGSGCGVCSPAIPDICEACLTDIDGALLIVAGTRVHSRCALFWEGMIILGEWQPAAMGVT
jgi:hypothetical protein